MNPPAAAYAAALAGFEAMTVHRLRALLALDPVEAFAVATGQAPAPAGLVAKVLADGRVREAWRRSGSAGSPERMWERCGELGIEVVVRGDPSYPPVLADDRLPPPVLFLRGDPSLLATGRRVGIVGTRNATAAGRHAASMIATGLAEAGVHVVSGLARGIDGAAHRAVAAQPAPGRPIAVVASGLDVVYPPEHAGLWQAVGERGVLVSESPPGTAPEAHRFPLRNRIIAALSEILVVVESRSAGGSLITAGEAAERGIPVMAVPGGIHNRAAEGTNDLVRDGAAPVIEAADVLRALSIDHRRSTVPIADQRPHPRPADLAVYRSCAQRPRTIDEVTGALGGDLVQAAMALARLEQAGWLAQTDGWYEAVGAPLRWHPAAPTNPDEGLASDPSGRRDA